MAYFPTIPDETAFSEGASPVTPIAGVFDDSLGAVASGESGSLRITEKRAAHVNLRSETGTELGTAAAPLRVDPTGTTKQPVTLFDSAGTPIVLSSGRILVDGSGVTQPISAVSLPLPTGASTAAKQPAIGTAGTSSADVLSIQGVSGGTAIPISGSITATNPSVGTDLATAPTSDTLVGAKYTTSAPTPTSGQMVALQADQNGNLKVTLSSAMIQPVRTVTASTDTATINDYFLRLDATSNNITETLPTGLSTAQTMVLKLKRIDSTTHTITVSASPNLVNGATSVLLPNVNQAFEVQWNGTGWDIEAAHLLNVGTIYSSNGLAKLDSSSAQLSASGTAALLALCPGVQNTDPGIVIAGAGNSNNGIYIDADLLELRSSASSAIFAQLQASGFTISVPILGTLGAWQNWTPTATPSAGTLSSLTYDAHLFLRIGSIVFFTFTARFTLSAPANVAFSLPVNATAAGASNVVNFNAGAPGYGQQGTSVVTVQSAGGSIAAGAQIFIVTGFYPA
jgi:hypothetical protein